MPYLVHLLLYFIERDEIDIRVIPMGRFAEPEEVAALAVFLASPLGAYITGASNPVDGGRMAKI